MEPLDIQEPDEIPQENRIFVLIRAWRFLQSNVLSLVRFRWLRIPLQLLKTLLVRSILTVPRLSYDIVKDEDGNDRLRLRNIGAHTPRMIESDLNTIDVHYQDTANGNKIICILLKHESPKFTMIVSHNVNEDVCSQLDFLGHLRDSLHCNVFSYEYSGFGLATGERSEANIYADADAALDAYLTTFNTGIPICFFGQNFGCAPTIHLVVGYPEVAGCFLVSPFRFLPMNHQYLTALFNLRVFDCEQPMKRIRCPTLIMHANVQNRTELAHGHLIHYIYLFNNRGAAPFVRLQSRYSNAQINATDHIRDFLIERLHIDVPSTYNPA